MSQFAQPQFSRKVVNRAGDTLVAGTSASLDDIEVALEVINNWRSSHSRPLLFARLLLARRASRFAGDALVAQRLKRLSSIEAKLSRNPNMKLSQMQDIGGCRAVLKDIRAVRDLQANYERSNAKSPIHRPQCCEKYDYIAQPKADGYRGVHLVYKYRTHEHSPLIVYKDLRIEIQLRTQLQHAWATAVETVGAFTSQALKSGLGSDKWKRFFVLMSAAIALRESAPRVRSAPPRKAELTQELRALTADIGALPMLEGMGAAVNYSQANVAKAQLFLLKLNQITNEVIVWEFTKEQEELANQTYLDQEKRTAEEPGTQVVLVSVDSLAALPIAYPNYYLDTKAFADAVRRAIA
jgi:hypothetical protein